MEVQTGDIKAIVNMEKCSDGEYREIKNHAVSDLLEPGSVFKTASIMVCLDEGKCDTTKRVETGGGVWPMYGRQMKDHNWRKGGYGTLTLPQTLQVSSNIGVSRIVDEYYHNQPEKFVEALYRIGIATTSRFLSWVRRLPASACRRKTRPVATGRTGATPPCLGCR